MTFKLKIEQNRSQEPVPAGTYLARIVHVIKLGDHFDDYQGRNTVRQKMGISYEIVSNTRQANNEPWVLIELYNLSTYQKSRLFPVLQTCFSTLDDGQELDLTEMLDNPVSITVVQKPWKDTVFSRVENVSAVPAGVEIPGSTTELLQFDLESFDDEVFSKLPKRFRSKISERIITANTEEAALEDVSY